MERTQVSLPKYLRDKLDEEGNKKGIGISEMVRYILFQYYEESDNNE
jgi:metal-responsive CopG/Arc/MetJ family transcriptional regulator